MCGVALYGDAALAAERRLDSVEVLSPRALPIWELRRGEDRLVIFSDFWPRKRSEATYVDADLLRELTRDAEAYVSGPGVAADDSVSVWQGLWLWRAYRQAMRNPDGARLSDILDPALRARWHAARARFLRSNRRGEFWRPWYAAFKLYEAALDRFGIAEGLTLSGTLQATFEQRDEDRVDARYSFKVDASRQAVRSFEIDADQSVACLAQTLDRLGPTFDTAGEGADAWDSGDLDALRAYFERVPPLERCWERLINQHAAELQGMPDPYDQADRHWLGVVTALFRDKNTVVTYLPARTLFAREGVITELMAQGFALQRRR